MNLHSHKRTNTHKHTCGYFLVSTEFRKMKSRQSSIFGVWICLPGLRTKHFLARLSSFPKSETNIIKYSYITANQIFFLNIIQSLCYSQNYSVWHVSSHPLSMFDYTTSSWFKDHWNQWKHSYSLQMKCFPFELQRWSKKIWSSVAFCRLSVQPVADLWRPGCYLPLPRWHRAGHLLLQTGTACIWRVKGTFCLLSLFVL